MADLEHPRPGPARQVWRALCRPYNEVVAVKLLDLENMNCSLVCVEGCRARRRRGVGVAVGAEPARGVGDRAGRVFRVL